MIRTTFIAAALGFCAASTGAQTPAPATPPSPQPPTINQPATPPAPVVKAKRARAAAKWPAFDFSDLEDQLSDLKTEFRMPAMPDMDFDLVVPSAPAMPFDVEIPEMPDMPFDVEMPQMPDMPFNVEMPRTPAVALHVKMPAMPDMDFDVDMPVAAMPAMPPMGMEPMVMAPVARAMARVGGQSPFERQFSGIAANPPQAWAQADPADSLYRLARETLNRGEYARAAELFNGITQRFPNSAYASDARYWRAFALYRIGGTNELHAALAALQENNRGYRQASLQADAGVLAARIRGALAMKGDPNAARDVKNDATQPGEACDREDLAVRIEALNSLGQTDPESTTPILRRVLARRDDCSASLRRAALWLLGRRTDAESTGLVMNAARNDPDLRVRADALRFLAAMPGDQAISTIEEIARTPGNEELQRAAVSALGRSDNPRARQSIRAIIEKADLSENLRASALASVDAEHTADNGAYIRSIYPRLDTPRLKAAAIRAAARIGGNDNDQWLLSIVRNPNEPVDVRAMALRYAGRSTIPIGDLVGMYDGAGDRPLREQLISLYAQRTDPQATDKLLDIAKKGTDPDMRRMAISALSRKNDPRTKQALLEIIDK
jgi:HEAT repeat protein